LKNVIRFSNPHLEREKVREQACNWLAKMDAGMDEADSEALLNWLGESPVHQEMLLAMADFFDQMSVLSELSEVFPFRKYSSRSEPAPWRRGVAALAASVCLVVGFVLGVNWWQEQSVRSIAGQDTQHVYETQIGQQSTVALADGSQVILNTNTQMEIVFTDNERRIYLRRGEGLFSVAKDESRPFRVFAGQRVVEAVGTAFTVQRTQENSVQVMVTEGKVNLRVFHQDYEEKEMGAWTETMLQDSHVVHLVAGEFADSGNEALEAVSTSLVLPEEMEVKLAWQHGMLLFQGDPLEQVLEEFGRYTTIKLEAAEAVKDIRVGGYFRAGDVDKLLVGIEKNFQIDVQKISENHILLTAR